MRACVSIAYMCVRVCVRAFVYMCVRLWVCCVCEGKGEWKGVRGGGWEVGVSKGMTSLGTKE